MGVVGAALRGFGRALSKKSGTIKSVKPAKNLTARRKTHDELVAAVDKHTKSRNASKIKRDATAKGSKIHDTYEKASSEAKKSNKKLLGKTIGAGAASLTGIVGVHVAAKKKFPKYKKFAESDIKTVDGKLKIVPRKKK